VRKKRIFSGQNMGGIKEPTFSTESVAISQSKVVATDPSAVLSLNLVAAAEGCFRRPTVSVSGKGNPNY
jgi:hypothetical protein